MKRSEVKIRKSLVIEVGDFAEESGLEIEYKYRIKPIIVYLMQGYIRGSYDEVLEGKSAKYDDRNVKVDRQRYAMNSILRNKFSDKAYKEDKISNWCHAKSLVEMLLRMYIDGEILIDRL